MSVTPPLRPAMTWERDTPMRTERCVCGGLIEVWPGDDVRHVLFDHYKGDRHACWTHERERRIALMEENEMRYAWGDR